MLKEHTYKLKEIADTYNVPLANLFETYSNLQTRYLSRDLKKGINLPSTMVLDVYGSQAINVMDKYHKIKQR